MSLVVIIIFVVVVIVVVDGILINNSSGKERIVADSQNLRDSRQSETSCVRAADL